MQLAGAPEGAPVQAERRPAVDHRIRIGRACRPQLMRDPLAGLPDSRQSLKYFQEI
jgi:hypothetical protein